MKIARWRDYQNKFVIEEVPVPEVSRRELLIRVKSCGVSGTDVYRYDERHTIDIKPFQPGETPGHEVAGVVVRDNKDMINFMTLMSKEIRVQGNAAHTIQEMKKSLKAMQGGGVKVKRFITHHFPLEKVNEAFEVRMRDERAIAVIVHP